MKKFGVYVFSTSKTGFYTLHDISLFFKLKTPKTLKNFIFGFGKKKNCIKKIIKLSFKIVRRKMHLILKIRVRRFSDNFKGTQPV
jgi:hypothetical protein